MEASHSAAFLPLLHSFGLSLQSSPPTHKAGNLLDLVFVRNCSPSNLTVTPLHLSDHHFISFSIPLAPLPPPLLLPALSQSAVTSTLSHPPLLPLKSLLLSLLLNPSLISPLILLLLLYFPLSSALNSLCSLVSRPARASPPSPWISDTLHTSRASLRAAERKWGKSRDPSDLSSYQSLLATFSSAITSAKRDYYHTKINVIV